VKKATVSGSPRRTIGAQMHPTVNTAVNGYGNGIAGEIPGRKTGSPQIGESMNRNSRRIIMLGIGMAAVAACAADPVGAPGAGSPPVIAPKKEESARPPVQPVPAESRTPEEAARRAADPKDPSGALIVAPPAAGNSKP
jgi:hypothetical protein